MSKQLSIVDSLRALEKPFSAQNAYALKFESECLFAKQQLMKNNTTLQAAENNQASLRSAILNTAAIGISLNPALSHAYLVPRNGAICLDISYRGLVKLATDSGAIKWAKTELVYDDEPFEWVNMVTLPIHKLNPFGGKRSGNTIDGVVGGYCVAQLADNSYLLDHMSIADIQKVADTSKAKSGPWKDWPLEMAKKTLVKRASKSWPQSGERERLDKAVEILNEHEGLDEPIIARTSDFMRPTAEQTATYLELAKGPAVDFYIWVMAQDERLRTSLPGCEFERGEKGRMMKYFNTHFENGRLTLEDWVTQLSDMCDLSDDLAVSGFIAELSVSQCTAVIDRLPPQFQLFIHKVRSAA